MKKISIITLSLFVLGVFFCNSTFAQTKNATSSSQGIVVATVGINNAKIISQNDRDFVISFDISNKVGAQPQIKYSVELTSTSTSNPIVFDEKVYDETLSLNGNTFVSKTINYTVPQSIQKGTYSLRIKSKNSSGLMLAISYLGNINIIDNTTNSIEILPDSCSLFVNTIKSTGQEAILSTTTDTFTAKCKVNSTFTSNSTLTPTFITKSHTSFGNTVADSGGQKESITIKKGTNDIIVTLPKANTPQDYNLSFGLFSSDGKTTSNTISFHYLLFGQSGIIQNTIFNKTYYYKGDTANLQIFSTQTGIQTGTSSITVLVSDSDGACSATSTKQISSFSVTNLSIPIIKDCNSPKANISLSANGKILDSNNFQITTATGTSNTTPDDTTTIFIITIIIVILFIGTLVYGRRYFSWKIFVLTLLFFTAFYGTSKMAIGAGYSPTVSISAASTIINYNASTTITWRSTNASSCSVAANSNSSWSSATSSSQSSGPLATTTIFTLSCTNANGAISTSTTVSVTPPLSVTISASPASVSYDTSAFLSWNSTGTKSCNITDNNGNYEAAGTSTGSALSYYTLLSDTTFLISCTGSNGKFATSSTVVHVILPTATISTLTNPVYAGATTTIYWNSTSTSYCMLNNGGGSQYYGTLGWNTGNRSLPPSGSVVTLPITMMNNTYNLSCYNNTGITNAYSSLQIDVISPHTAFMTASPSFVSSGASTNISFTVNPLSTNNVTSCTLTGNGSSTVYKNTSGIRVFSGSQSSGVITKATPFLLSCTYSTGVVVTDNLVINLSSSSPGITKFSAASTTVSSGASTTISFTANNASYCTLAGNLGTTVYYNASSSFNYVTQFSSSGNNGGIVIDSLNNIRLDSSNIAIDSLGNMYVVLSNGNIVDKFDSSGRYLFQFGSYGSGNGQFNYPQGIAVDSLGNVYVADGANNGRVEKFDSSGNYLSQFKGPSDSACPINSSGVSWNCGGPNGITIDYFSGNIYTVSNYSFGSCPEGGGVCGLGFDGAVEKFDSSGQFISKFYHVYNRYPTYPRGIVTDFSGNIYVTDVGYSAYDNSVMEFNSSGTYINNFDRSPYVSPGAMAKDSSGNIYFIDSKNNLVNIYGISLPSLSGSQSSGPITGGTNFELSCFNSAGAETDAYLQINTNQQPQTCGYSIWGLCQNGSQTRTVTSSPVGCVAPSNPVLTQECSLPLVGHIYAATNTVAYNGTTTVSWAVNWPGENAASCQVAKITKKDADTCATNNTCEEYSIIEGGCSEKSCINFNGATTTEQLTEDTYYVLNCQINTTQTVIYDHQLITVSSPDQSPVTSTCTPSQSDGGIDMYINKDTTWTVGLSTSTSETPTTTWSGTNITNAITQSGLSLVKVYTTVGKKTIYATTIGTYNDGTTTFSSFCSTSTIMEANNGTTTQMTN